MRFGWVGCHVEGLSALEALLAARTPITGVITLRPELAAQRSGAVDYAPLCVRYGIPLARVGNINEPDGLAALRTLDADVVFVIGWSQILRPAALQLARTGMIGAHASLLPQLRGSAPINWALIRGERQTGNSLIWLAQDVDRGAIIDQTAFCITPYDTCASLYERVAASNRDMLLRLVPRLLAGEHPGRVQPAGDEPVLPRRRPADGRIDWRQPSRAVYDFIRALTRPYPGAFSWLEGRRWTIWHAAHLPAENGPGLRATPGAVLGPVVSPVEATCGQMVGCGAGAVVLLELQADDGTVLRGRELSDQPWTGKRWNHEDPQPESSAQ